MQKLQINTILAFEAINILGDDTGNSSCSGNTFVAWTPVDTDEWAILDSGALSLVAGRYKCFIGTYSTTTKTAKFRAIVANVSGSQFTNADASTWQVMDIGDFMITSATDDIRVTIEDPTNSNLVGIDCVWLIPYSAGSNGAFFMDLSRQILNESKILRKVVER
jgi:hypothetical protein